MNATQRFARMATSLVVHRPVLWRVFRRPVRALFDRVAPRWDSMRGPAHLFPLEAALAQLDRAPRTALDLGTGTGDGAVVIARRWPEARVVGADLSPQMVEEARRKLPADLAERVSFDVADAARLAYGDGAFELVALLNMIPFFDELARVTASGGTLVIAFSRGAGTPIYVAPERLRAELGRRGFADFRDVSAGDGSAVVARKRRAG